MSAETAPATANALVTTEQPMPTPEEIAEITRKAVHNCECAAISFEEMKQAGNRLNDGLGKSCDEGAKMFRTRGKAQAALLTSFSAYTHEQCEVVKKLLEQADKASPPPNPEA